METIQEGLVYYQQFVDDLVERGDGALAEWAVGKGWPDTPDNAAINALLRTLTQDQKEVLRNIIQQARRGGMHDVLAFLDEKVAIDELRLTEKGVRYPLDPYGEGFHYAFVSRMEGDAWPEDADLEATEG